MSFPLYDILLKDVPDRELTKEEKIKIISTITTLDQKEQNNIFTIIRIHSLRNNSNGNIFDIPYDGKVDKISNGLEDRCFSKVAEKISNGDNCKGDNCKGDNCKGDNCKGDRSFSKVAEQ